MLFLKFVFHFLQTVSVGFKTHLNVFYSLKFIFMFCWVFFVCLFVSFVYPNIALIISFKKQQKDSNYYCNYFPSASPLRAGVGKVFYLKGHNECKTLTELSVLLAHLIGEKKKKSSDTRKLCFHVY